MGHSETKSYQTGIIITLILENVLWAQELDNQQRRALLVMEDRLRLLQLHKNNQLSKLQTELEKTHPEAAAWVQDILSVSEEKQD